MSLTTEERAFFDEQGYLLLRGAVSSDSISRLEHQFLGLVEQWTAHSFPTWEDRELAHFLLGNRELERKLYDGVRSFSWLSEFSMDKGLKDAIQGLLHEPAALLGKIPLRMDLPNVTRELAVWHQDFWYVKGSIDTITAWVPLQDTPFERGCLLIMPGSHKLGPLAHDLTVLGKRHLPSNIFERSVRYVEMRRGDVLLFHSLLLHSSGLNISDTTRFSVQARYCPTRAAADPGMGGLIPI